jgi:hypothetical protein
VRLGAAPLRQVADGEHRQLLHLHGDGRVQHVDRHQLAHPGPLAVQQGRQRPLEGAVGGDRVHRVGPGGQRRVARPADAVHRPGHRLEQQVLAGPPRVRAGFPVAGDRHVHQPRVDRPQRRVVDAQARRHARTVVLQEHVGAAGQLEEDLVSLGGLEVQRDAALVAVERQERGVDAVAGGAAGGGVPLPLAGDRLHLDHVGAQVAQAHRRERPGHRDRQVEHAVAGQHFPAGRPRPLSAHGTWARGAA